MRFVADIRRNFLLVFILTTILFSFVKCQDERDLRNYNRSRVFQPLPPRDQRQDQRPDLVYVPRIGYIRGVPQYQQLRYRSINAFLGIKYGRVGTGLARFQKATLPQYYDEQYIDATQEPPNCPQYPEINLQLKNADENTVDCLTLNIYVPENRSEYLPVMVFVHGEMLFDGGAGEAQPDYLLEHNLILVSVNYRLAPFGFFTTLTDEMPGNVALADIHMALEWVNNNIYAFGGDPRQVTLFGQAGGATLVHALSISGKADDLFQKIILQSGTALNPYFLDEDPLLIMHSFMRLSRCPPGSVQHINQCFERMSNYEIMSLFKQHWETNEPNGVAFTGGFKLVVGDKLGYLSAHPASLLTNNKRPVLAGVTKDAGAFILSRFYKQLESINSRNISIYINVVLKHTCPPKFHTVYRHLALTQIFTEEQKRLGSLNDIAHGLLELTTFILYRGPLLESIRHTYKNYPTYLYSFDYRGQYRRFGHLKNPLPFSLDSELTDDSIYIFPYPSDVAALNPEDMTIARSITTMWYNFALRDEPNPYSGVWPRVDNNAGPFVRITSNKQQTLERDVHFAEGLPLPPLYPQYYVSTTTTTTSRPYSRFSYRPNESVLPYDRYRQNDNRYNNNPRI